MIAPPANAVGGADFVIVRSALVVIAVDALAVRGDCGSVVEASEMSFVTLDAGVDEAALT